MVVRSVILIPADHWDLARLSLFESLLRKLLLLLLVLNPEAVDNNPEAVANNPDAPVACRNNVLFRTLNLFHSQLYDYFKTFGV